MPRRKLVLPALAVAGAVLFLGILLHLLLLRYERGDVYPEYSTLRADPLGTRAFYEALGSLDGYSVSRGYTTVRRQVAEHPHTLYYLGMASSELPFLAPDEVQQLDDYVKAGGRLVVALAPRSPSEGDDFQPFAKKKEPTKPKDKPARDATPAEKPANESDAPQTEQEKYERDELRKQDEFSKAHNEPVRHEHYHPTIEALLGFGTDLNHKTREKKDGVADGDETDKPEVIAFASSFGVAESALKWKSALYFVRIDPAWQVLYKAKGMPVMLRRTWGRGEVIIAGDSYFISNEALRDDRRPALLTLLAGAPGPLLFDETHLGTQEQEGIMSLTRKFRLEGYLLGMLVVLLLFLWRNSFPLVPPRAVHVRTALGGAVSGKDSRSGLVNLLRRNISPRDILRASFDAWKRAVTPARPHLRGRAAEMEAVLATTSPGSAREIVAAYHQLRQINQPIPSRHATQS